jgi:hypothetical protein
MSTDNRDAEIERLQREKAKLIEMLYEGADLQARLLFELGRIATFNETEPFEGQARLTAEMARKAIQTYKEPFNEPEC